MWNELTIVTSCTNYGKYLVDWANSIVAQSVRPGHVIIFTHGTLVDDRLGRNASLILRHAQIDAAHVHFAETLDLGTARNHAVSLTDSEWVLHLDADDALMPHALAMCQPLSAGADVVSAGYTRMGTTASGMSRKSRTYDSADGALALDLPAICSSNSPFRRSFWERSPYRTDLFGAWDTAFWIGLAHIGARFRATPQPIFHYRQHADSVFSKRQKTMSWGRVHTTAMLKSLRRSYDGVAVIVPRDYRITTDRQRNWDHVSEHYQLNHPDWKIIEGRCPSATWCKGFAIQDALNHTNADILIIADADCIVQPAALEASVSAVRNGAPWAMPHTTVRRLNEASTVLMLPEVPHTINWNGISALPLDRPVYDGAPGGGIVVVRRVFYEAVGGIPQAFQGWGSEDRALALLCSSLLGPCERGSGELLHFHHDPQIQSGLTARNLQTLRRLGQAALGGKDALVVAIATLPKAGGGKRPHMITRAPIEEITPEVRAERHSFAQRTRRRIP